jgi:3-hydroxymyristoyl/3-hydroxydecanoyl-(acyl carrier protein) dehydratase
MPGVIIIEAMAQVGGVLARLSIPGLWEARTGNHFFMSMDKVKFRNLFCRRSDCIRVRSSPHRIEDLESGGKALVKDSLVAEAELLATIG